MKPGYSKIGDVSLSDRDLFLQLILLKYKGPKTETKINRTFQMKEWTKLNM